jgi:hypothetical protein
MYPGRSVVSLSLGKQTDFQVFLEADSVSFFFLFSISKLDKTFTKCHDRKWRDASGASKNL